MDAKCEILDNVTTAVEGIITGNALGKIKRGFTCRAGKIRGAGTMYGNHSERWIGRRSIEKISCNEED